MKNIKDFGEFKLNEKRNEALKKVKTSSTVLDNFVMDVLKTQKLYQNEIPKLLANDKELITEFKEGRQAFNDLRILNDMLAKK